MSLTTFYRGFRKLLGAAVAFILGVGLMSANSGMAQTQQGDGDDVTVTGVVKDAAGYPLPGAAVIISGTSIGVITDLDGNFAIEIPSPAADKSLEFNLLGYEVLTVPVGLKNSSGSCDSPR